MTSPLAPLILLLFLSVGLLHAEEERYETLNYAEIEERLRGIDEELSTLAETSLRTGAGAIGFRSTRHQSAHNTEWIEIRMDGEHRIDEIVLVPNIYRDSQKGFRADGFPKEYRIYTGKEGETEGTLLRHFKADEGVSIAPKVIKGAGVSASWIRIEATHLSQRTFNKNSNHHYVFQLAEVFIFSEQRNVALHQRVLSSSQHPELPSSAWNKRFLVDGHTPYIMNAAEGRQSVGYISNLKQSPVFILDLLKPYPVSRIHFHALEQNDTVPQAYSGNHGIPAEIKVEGALRADFSDAVPLLLTESLNENDIGPIMMWNFPETTCRYIRLSEAQPSETFRPGFAEIELFSGHQNVAIKKRFTSSAPKLRNRSLRSLTDGHNLYGKILPVRDWLNQLARRQYLETLRPQLMLELAERNGRLKRNLRVINWVALFLLIGGLLLLWSQRRARLRAVAEVRERLAANLHDELGANLHAIALLGDFAKKIVTEKEETDEWQELNEVIDEVRTLTEESGETARYCTNMLESKGIHTNLIPEMERITKRMLSDLEHEVSFPPEHALHRLKPRRRVDLYLFYKECLTNIIRHSNATQVKVELSIEERAAVLRVSDDGHGYTEEEAPGSLRRRAKILGGNVEAEHLKPTGLRITLRFSTHHKTPFRRII